MVNHIRISKIPNNVHLFAYRHKNQLRPLTKHAFVKRLALVARLAGEELLQGHGIRIGATLFYLLLGLPMEAVKVMGRWSSDAFLRYLRKHAQILTPLIQANPRVRAPSLLPVHHSRPVPLSRAAVTLLPRGSKSR
jgi:hypothetical protein